MCSRLFSEISNNQKFSIELFLKITTWVLAYSLINVTAAAYQGIKKYFSHAQNFEPPFSKMAIQMIWIFAQHELASYKVKDSNYKCFNNIFIAENNLKKTY